jgi:hypothetical protein
METPFEASVERAKLLNAEARDMQATERGVMFIVCALIAISEDEAWTDYKIEDEGSSYLFAKLMGKEKFLELAVKYKTAAGVISDQAMDTGFALCQYMAKEQA